MIAIPAVDVRDGACVQLVGGSYADERIRIADPMEAAARWAAAGFRRLHIVDLDAATGCGDNGPVIDRLTGLAGVDVQVGGGVRSTERMTQLIDRGARSVVVGTRAVENAEWLARSAAQYPGRIIVAADVRGRNVVTHGWERGSSLDALDFIARLADMPLGGILVTAVHREGQMTGTDLPLMKEIVRTTAHPVIASGGIASLADLRDLADLGIHAAVLGMALYTGALDPDAVAQEFAA
jgi:phosphoribosylformimino-5-aminoimidazole carboxamide ribotide isomerase